MTALLLGLLGSPALRRRRAVAWVYALLARRAHAAYRAAQGAAAGREAGVLRPRFGSGSEPHLVTEGRVAVLASLAQGLKRRLAPVARWPVLPRWRQARARARLDRAELALSDAFRVLLAHGRLHRRRTLSWVVTDDLAVLDRYRSAFRAWEVAREAALRVGVQMK